MKQVSTVLFEPPSLRPSVELSGLVAVVPMECGLLLQANANAEEENSPNSVVTLHV